MRHEVEVLSSTESSESFEVSDDSVSSSASYKPPPCKMKKKTQVKTYPVSVYDTVYGSSEESNEEQTEDLENHEFSESELSVEKQDESDAPNTIELDTNSKLIFYNFENWLKCADGGQKNEHSAAQCRRQVELVVRYIGPEPSLDNILDKTILPDQWLNKFENEKKPGTVKSYLGSLSQFYGFLKCENIDVNATPDDLSSLSEQVKLWGRSYRKKSADRFWEKQIEYMASLRTPEQIKRFETSEVAREAVGLLGEYQSEERDPANQAEYTSVRDYILTVVCINNGSRSGALANMTLKEIERANLEDECFVVRVKNHKTLYPHGPVNVVFDRSLHKYTEIFIRKFRNSLEDVNTAGDAPVFITWNQGKMTSSQVGAQIGSCWSKVFRKDLSSGGATAFRKVAVSAVHECNEDLRGDLADLMAHKQSTADRYYLLKNKGKSAVKTSKELAKIMRTTSAPNVTEKDDADDNGVLSSRQLSGTSFGRHTWTNAETDALQNAFSTHIKRKSITMQEVRGIVDCTPMLQSISPTKVCDKIRSESHYSNFRDGRVTIFAK